MGVEDSFIPDDKLDDASVKVLESIDKIVEVWKSIKNF